MDFTGLKYLVVGTGVFGATIAERIANDLKERVVIVEKRDHIGGNSYSETDSDTGIEFHKYGTHIFHTSIKRVWEYINKFTSFNAYRHQVLAFYKAKVYQMPINLETINSFYEKNMRPFEAEEFLNSEINKEKIQSPKNLEEKAISLIGRPLYEAFIKGYTQKQWQIDCKLLPVSIINRFPVRYNYNENYFFDPLQGIPTDGFTAIFNRMLKNDNIEIQLNTDYFSIKDLIPSSCQVIYSGPIDRFFNYHYGKLQWRTLAFEKEVVEVEDYQGTAVMNYPEIETPYIRIHEPRHLHVERNYPKNRTLIIKKYPEMDKGENPYYPVNTGENQDIAGKYMIEKERLKNVIIGGRLGDYKYYDMDRAVNAALEVYEQRIGKQGICQ